MTYEAYTRAKYPWTVKEYEAYRAEREAAHPVRYERKTTKGRTIMPWNKDSSTMPNPHNVEPVLMEITSAYRTPSTRQLLDDAYELQRLTGDTPELTAHIHTLEDKYTHEQLARVPVCDNPTPQEANLTP